MAKVSTYLNFSRKTEEAFNFYKSVFGGEFGNGGISRMGDIPPSEGMPPIAEEDKNLVMHVELPILGGHVLMGTDAPESRGFKVVEGNSEGGKVTMALQETFWGAYYGNCTDKFGIQWMLNFPLK